jgi:thiol-disulfide isomerase/thioredoxin
MNKSFLHIQIILIFLLITFIYGTGKAQTTVMTKNYASCTEDTNMIIGETTLEQLNRNVEFWSEYLGNYASYTVNQEKLEEISTLLKGRIIHVVVVLGTWCGDTKEQLPIFQKVLDNLPSNNMTAEYIGVNRDNLAGETDISSLGIIFVPTFILYEKDKELGRIVEIPKGTMEEHIREIISNK